MVENSMPLNAHEKIGLIKNANANRPRINMIKIKADHSAVNELRTNVAKLSGRGKDNSWMKGMDQEQLRIIHRPPIE